MFGRPSGWLLLSSFARPCVSPSSHRSVRIHHILHCSFSHLPCVRFLFSLFDHAWLIKGSLRSLSGPCGGVMLGVLHLAGSQHATLTNKHGLLTGRQQHGRLGCHLLGRQHRLCLSALLHSYGHARRDMMLTHRLTSCLWTPSLRLLSLALVCIWMHPLRPSRPVPPLKMLPLSFLLPCFRVAAAAPRSARVLQLLVQTLMAPLLRCGYRGKCQLSRAPLVFWPCLHIRHHLTFPLHPLQKPSPRAHLRRTMSAPPWRDYIYLLPEACKTREALPANPAGMAPFPRQTAISCTTSTATRCSSGI